MVDNNDKPDGLADDMAEYLQTFLDETEEQLDALVDTMLALERDATRTNDLNEAFRLIHSIKGSAGMMGFDNITILTHHLENRFERFRSGTEQLDEPTMNVVLRCIDFLRQCNDRLRDGEQLGSSASLLDALRQLEQQADAPDTATAKNAADAESALTPESDDSPPLSSTDDATVSDAGIRMVVRFRDGLQLSDLKAKLILVRLSGLGDVRSTQPDLNELSESEQLSVFAIQLDSDHELDRLRGAADVDGVESIEFPTEPSPVTTDFVVESLVDSEPAATVNTEVSESTPSPAAQPGQHATVGEPAADQTRRSGNLDASTAGTPIAKVAETMRVDIERLDNLMNLVGELVVNRASFVQIFGQINPALRKATMLNRLREFSDGLQRTIETMEASDEDAEAQSTRIQQLRSGLELINEQTDIWEQGRHCFGKIGEAIDQLSRVSHSLQRGVLDTRMVPVAPLFNRFNRVVRDLCTERGKKVNLLIRGEKTELDKRMIDELGDPLVHLVRNSIDHGLEPPDVRVGYGKSEVGTIILEASHSGNNVLIHVRDDGGGIDVGRIKAKLIDREILSRSAVDELSREQALEYIWHPGFSTATAITDVSGRGVGMDVVRTRISSMNGSIVVDSTPQQGTCFTLKLPLTLAIINCLLVRLRHVVFSMPIDNVREIVSVKERDVIVVRGKRTIDVRGEYLPLVSIDDMFHWHSIDFGYDTAMVTGPSDSNDEPVNIVILHAGGRVMGLRVDELLGSQDIVIKSLSDNFRDIRGLSGASILGDGSVCLMLDVSAAIEMAVSPSRIQETEEAAT